MATPSHRFLLAEDAPPSKREILHCALHLFVRDGLCETSIRNIADAAGYTNPALYKFFESKEALALHLFERCYLELASVVRASQAAGAGFEANLSALLAAYGRVLDESLEAVLYVNDNLRHFWPRLPARARRQSLLSLIRGLVRQGVREGVVGEDTDVALAVATVAGALGQVARMSYFGELRGPASQHVVGLEGLLGQALVGGAS